MAMPSGYELVNPQWLPIQLVDPLELIQPPQEQRQFHPPGQPPPVQQQDNHRILLDREGLPLAWKACPAVVAPSESQLTKQLRRLPPQLRQQRPCVAVQLM